MWTTLLMVGILKHQRGLKLRGECGAVWCDVYRCGIDVREAMFIGITRTCAACRRCCIARNMQDCRSFAANASTSDGPHSNQQRQSMTTAPCLSSPSPPALYPSALSSVVSIPVQRVKLSVSVQLPPSTKTAVANHCFA